jgi:hypothetical protein
VNFIPTGTDYHVDFGNASSLVSLKVGNKSIYERLVDAVWRAVGVRVVLEYAQLTACSSICAAPIGPPDSPKNRTFAALCLVCAIHWHRLVPSAPRVVFLSISTFPAIYFSRDVTMYLKVVVSFTSRWPAPAGFDRFKQDRHRFQAVQSLSFGGRFD